MGQGCLTPATLDLPEYGVEFGSSDLPAWVSAGGKALFDQAVGIASTDPGRDPTLPQFASYDGERLTEDERLAAQILRDGASSYQPFIDEAESISDTLGQGYDAATREELMGDPYSGMTNEELLGGEFSLAQAQPFLDIYQGAQDASVRELEKQTLRNQVQARAQAARGGAFGGSRLGITEAMLGSEGAMGAADLRARAAAEGLGFAADRFDRDRDARFDAESMRRSQFDADRSSRFAAEDALRTAQMQSFRDLAPLTQSLQEAAAQGLISSGEAQRRLDQAAIDLANQQDMEDRFREREALNFALGALQGVPYQSSTMGYRVGSQTGQAPSLFGQLLGAGGSAAAAYYASR
jgi:hypothetical protein